MANINTKICQLVKDFAQKNWLLRGEDKISFGANTGFKAPL
jgi:hypothetical protein